MKVGDLVRHRPTDCRAIVLDIVPADTRYRGGDAVKVCWVSSCSPSAAGWSWVGTKAAGSTEWVKASTLEPLTSS